MFKGILPSHKRIVSSDFTMLTNLADSGKENNKPGSLMFGPNVAGRNKPPLSLSKGYGQPHEQKKRGEVPLKDQTEPAGTNLAFDKLLDELQIPPTLRPKLAGMDATVKAAMLKGSHKVLSKAQVTSSVTPRGTLRKTRSSESLGSPRPQKPSNDYDILMPPNPSFVHEHPASRPGSPRLSNTHARGSSFDLPRSFSRSQLHLPVSMSDGGSKEKGSSVSKNISPTKFFSMLSGTSTLQLDVDSIKKLRLLLRNESASWSQEFLRIGGYSALLTRLNEILEVEWREEQHDDQVLHELLRCLKALSTSSIGCVALRSSCPTPYAQLISLLYSDKKPGDVATRQLIIDLLLVLFDLYPPNSLPSTGHSPYSGRSYPRREVWEMDSSPASNVITLPAPHKNLFSFIRTLLLIPAPPPSECPAPPISPHAFIENLHQPRIYKTYLQELSDVCRDYFWVFCHPNNTVWILSETDEGKVEKPRAPGGMTGGVEFEAMGYFTTHLRLLNAISKAAGDLKLPKDHELSAHRLHRDLFLSGIERIILISRKASTTYYPTLHLELARYIALAGQAGYELPWTVSRLMGLPPAPLCKNPSAHSAMTAQTQVHTPTKRGTPPVLASPKKVEVIRIE